MNGTHMTLLRNIVKGICDSLDKYVDYLKKQAVEVSKNHKTAVLPESKIEDFMIIKLKYHSYDDSAWEDRFLNLKNILSGTDFFVLVEINMRAFKDSDVKCKVSVDEPEFPLASASELQKLWLE